jgi:hypothetical protein
MLNVLAGAQTDGQRMRFYFGDTVTIDLRVPLLIASQCCSFARVARSTSKCRCTYVERARHPGPPGHETAASATDRRSSPAVIYALLSYSIWASARAHLSADDPLAAVQEAVLLQHLCSLRIRFASTVVLYGGVVSRQNRGSMTYRCVEPAIERAMIS